MSEHVIYVVEALAPGDGETKTGIFQRQHTVDAWLRSLGDEVTRTVRPVPLVDQRHNHTMGIGAPAVG